MSERNDEAVTLALLKTEVDALRDEVAALTKSTGDLVAAWNAAATFVKFIKLLSSLIAAGGAIWLFFRSGWK